jgi:hypothetical protein
MAGVSQGTYNDSTGVTWNSDAYFTGGQSTVRSNQVVQNTPDPTLYNGERWGADASGNPTSFAYTFNVSAGNYSVQLRFAESFCTGPGQRLFDVAINGTTVLSNFDIYATAGGANIADNESFTVSVSGANPTIQIVFTPGAMQNPKIDAIAVTPQ